MTESERQVVITFLKDLIKDLEKGKGGNDIELEKLVTKHMVDLGIPAHVKGYNYIRTAIIVSLKDEDMLNGLTKKLYSEVAKKFHSTGAKVERAIGSAIETMWFKGNAKAQFEIFGYSRVEGIKKPTNREFLKAIVDYLRLNS